MRDERIARKGHDNTFILIDNHIDNVLETSLFSGRFHIGMDRVVF